MQAVLSTNPLHDFEVLSSSYLY